MVICRCQEEPKYKLVRGENPKNNFNFERKSENMNKETKDTLKKVAEYTAEENKKLKNKENKILLNIFFLISLILFNAHCACKIKSIF